MAHCGTKGLAETISLLVYPWVVFQLFSLLCLVVSSFGAFTTDALREVERRQVTTNGRGRQSEGTVAGIHRQSTSRDQGQVDNSSYLHHRFLNGRLNDTRVQVRGSGRSGDAVTVGSSFLLGFLSQRVSSIGHILLECWKRTQSCIASRCIVPLRADFSVIGRVRPDPEHPYSPPHMQLAARHPLSRLCH